MVLVHLPARNPDKSTLFFIPLNPAIEIPWQNRSTTPRLNAEILHQPKVWVRRKKKKQKKLNYKKQIPLTDWYLEHLGYKCFPYIQTCGVRNLFICKKKNIKTLEACGVYISG